MDRETLPARAQRVPLGPPPLRGRAQRLGVDRPAVEEHPARPGQQQAARQRLQAQLSVAAPIKQMARTPAGHFHSTDAAYLPAALFRPSMISFLASSTVPQPSRSEERRV